MDAYYYYWKVPSLILIPIFLCFGILVFVDVFQSQYFANPLKIRVLYTPTEDPDSVLSLKAEVESSTDVDAKSLKGFAIKTRGCRIPDMDPFDESVLSSIVNPRAPKCNGGIPPLFDSNLTHLFVIESSFSAYNIVHPHNLFCCYQQLFRVEPKNHSFHRDVDLSENCVKINLTQSIAKEFIVLTCEYQEKIIYRDFFAFVPVKTKPAIDKDEKVNVLVIGLDSMSRVNFHRQMPHTAAYLKKIGALELMGFNKIGDNTFPNLMPVLTGYSEEEIVKTCWTAPLEFFDNCTFLWDLYKNAGYTTGLGEDSNWMGLFNFNRGGFKRQPTDYDYNHFNLIAELKIGNWHKMNVIECIGGRDSYKVLLNYVKIFAQRMCLEKIPYFAFFWSSSLSHDFLNKPKLGDHYVKSIFKSLMAEGSKNTVLVFMSDHGMRWGSIRVTYQGRLEERLPFAYIKLPDWFKEKYPLPYRNLVQNTRRLTTPFDLFYTLKSLLSLDNLTRTNGKEEHGYSLFSRVPDNRTCANAGIASHWCACQKGIKIDVKRDIVIKVAKFAVKEMNAMLVGYAQCAKLDLRRVLFAQQMSHQSNKDIRRGFNHFVDYMLTFQTAPGDGIFEATVRLQSGGTTKEVIGTISRLNLYGKQSACITDYHLKLYCYCKYLF